MSHGNGHGKADSVSIDIVDDGHGYAYFEPGKHKPSLESLPEWLNTAFLEWLQAHRNRAVRSTLPIVSHGATIRLHVWYEPSSA